MEPEEQNTQNPKQWTDEKRKKRLVLYGKYAVIGIVVGNILIFIGDKVSETNLVLGQVVIAGLGGTLGLIGNFFVLAFLFRLTKNWLDKRKEKENKDSET